MTTRPWLAHNPWQAGATGAFAHADPFTEQTVNYTLTPCDGGTLAVPSGKLIATSLCMDLSLDDDGCGGWFEVPPGDARIVLTTAAEAGGEGVGELAYISLLFTDGDETQREVAMRQQPPGEDPDDGIFFVDKYVLALADLEAVRAACPDAATLDAVIDAGVLDPDVALEDTSLALPGGATIRSLRVPNGIAAGVIGRDAAGAVVALHLQCFVIGTTGEEGEFED